MTQTAAAQAPGGAPPAEAVDPTCVREILARHGRGRGALIAALQDLQDLYGYLPQEALKAVADETGRSLVDVYGIATFYRDDRELWEANLAEARAAAAATGAPFAEDLVDTFLDGAHYEWADNDRLAREAPRRVGRRDVRTLMDVVPLDAGLVRGSHGVPHPDPALSPVLMTTDPGLLDGDRLEATSVRDVILRHVFRE